MIQGAMLAMIASAAEGSGVGGLQYMGDTDSMDLYNDLYVYYLVYRYCMSNK